MKKNFIKVVSENLKTILYALLIAVLIRSLFFQPFYIPSSSMEPTLLIGDRIFVSKYSYGYSKHSFPFSPSIYNKRLLKKEPKYGDLVVFKTPADNRTDYIKRLIGLPGDEIQFRNGKLFINNNEIIRKEIKIVEEIRCGSTNIIAKAYEETLPNGLKHVAVYNKNGTTQNSDKYIVPSNHYFFLGDNRDCSRDSRFLSSVGYVSDLNLVGKANLIFFSNDTLQGSVLKFWNWGNSLRINRFFKKL
ncbi:MAG: signal peptidase I [Pelagibacterales bacterium MED-G40]|nr:MAG: signal peptidase I [Pelagibacterales bacterium MED-G40]|tara:strand:- start:17705 stop:18442 length:738 start_codon:yes stop_codon:yes gene_type:complete